MKHIVIFATSLLLLSCHGYDNPLDVRREIMQAMKGDYQITKFVNQDTTIHNLCTITLTYEDVDLNSEFPQIYFDNILSKYSYIFKYFGAAYANNVPPDYSGRSWIYWEADVYEKRINLWAIIGLMDIHKVLNREIISSKEEKWWLVINGELEEIYLKKL